MNEFLTTLLQAVLVAAVPMCAAFIGKGLKALASYLGQKSENDKAKKYLAAAADAVAQAKNLLTAEAAAYLQTAYGDLNEYLKSRIEAEVRNQKLGVGTLLSILLSFHLNHGLVSSLIDYCRKTVSTGAPFIFYQAHDTGFVPAGNARLILNIFIVQVAGNFQQGHTVLVLAENTLYHNDFHGMGGYHAVLILISERNIPLFHAVLHLTFSGICSVSASPPMR